MTTQARNRIVTYAAPTVAQRVRDGVAMLDEHQPGWADGVDVDTLDISQQDGCVLGQLYGSFDAGVKRLYGDGFEYRACGHGFNVGSQYDEPDDEDRSDEDRVEYAALNAEWRRVVRERQSKGCGL